MVKDKWQIAEDILLSDIKIDPSWQLLGFPDSAYRVNLDDPSQKGQPIDTAENAKEMILLSDLTHETSTGQCSQPRLLNPMLSQSAVALRICTEMEMLYLNSVLTKWGIL